MVRKKWTVFGLLIFRSRFFGLFSAEGWTKPGHFGGQNISPPISNSATVCKFAAPLHGRRSVPGRRHPKNAHIGSRSLCRKVDTKLDLPTWSDRSEKGGPPDETQFHGHRFSGADTLKTCCARAPAPVAGKGGRAQNCKAASVVRYGFGCGVRTAVPRRPGVFVTLG